MGKHSVLDRRVGLALIAIFAMSVGPAFAQNPGLHRCTRTTEFTTDVSTEISARPAIICSVHLIATDTNAWGLVFDSPSNADQQTVEHGQIRRISEPGVATQYNSTSQYFGDEGQLTQFGLGAFVVRGRLIVHWDT